MGLVYRDVIATPVTLLEFHLSFSNVAIPMGKLCCQHVNYLDVPEYSHDTA